MSERYDVVICGGGPAGSATALALLRRGARVALVERRGEADERMGESLRGIASEALRELGVLDAFRRLETRPSHLHRAAWGGRTEERDSIRMKYGPDLHLERARFDALLLDTAVTRGLSLFRPATLRAVTRARDGYRLLVEHASETRALDARRLIDATGRGATPSRRCGAVRRDADRLIGVARSFARGAREPSTLVEASDEGWWYSAPLPRGRMVALFVTDGDSPARRASSAAVWTRCLESAPLTSARLAQAEDVGAPRSYFAAPSLLDWDPCRELVPVGDAAMSFDPIAADGLCFALRSGIEAAAALLGARGSLESYRAGVRRIFDEHVARRELVYASERRVRSTPFWQHPRGRLAGAAASFAHRAFF